MDPTINTGYEANRPTDAVIPPTIDSVTQKQSAKRRLGKLPTNRKNKQRKATPAPIEPVPNNSPLLNPDHQVILNKYHRLIQQARDSTTDTSPTTDELLAIIRQWEPKRDIICLYVRWARQLPKNFALDSIATLLCLADQCNYTPLDFLLKVKTLNVSRSTTSFGVSLSFDLKPTKDGEALSRQFLGLSVTLALLQANITNSNGILGKNKMRSNTPRLNQAMTVGLGKANGNQATFQATPQIEFHTGQALTNRLWRCITHRWISLYILEHLFRAKDPCSYWNHQDALIYSFRMFANAGRSRYDYLAPLAGLCLQYVDPKQDIESNRDILNAIWKDPEKFVPYGNTFLTTITEKEKIKIITSTFLDLARVCPQKCSYDPRHQPLEKRWLMLRAFVFHFWLHQTKNRNICVHVVSNLKPHHFKVSAGLKKSSKEHPEGSSGGIAVIDTTPKARTTSIATTENRCFDVQDSTTTTTHDSTGTNIIEDLPGGLESLLSTRISLETPDEPTNPPIVDGISLIHPTTMRDHVSSYLLVHTEDAIDIVSELSSLEVYSADNLYKQRHGRFSGDKTFYPSNYVGDVRLLVASNAKCFIDRRSRYFHVARESSSYLKQHGRLLPSIAQLKSLCEAVVAHGKHDATRSNGQFRVNIGCGGQDRRDGVPCHLHDSGFQKRLEADPQFDSVLIRRSIGQCTEMIWKICQDMQRDASDSPMAQDHIRTRMYSSHLATYLMMNEEVGFEDVTIVISHLYPIAHNVSYHVDSMNDSVAGYTRTCCLNISLLVLEDKKIKNIVHFQVIANFRKVIREFLVPHKRALNSVTGSAKRYLHRWQQNINKIYAGTTSKVPTPFERSHFFLDDCLSYETFVIHDDITVEYLLTEIGVSRVMSFSIYIHHLMKLKTRLELHQRLELCFVCSFLSNPFWFDHVMGILIECHFDDGHEFEFGVHPFYDWARYTPQIFGNWQGGPYNRWSPCGGARSIPEVFGGHKEATTAEQSTGTQHLQHIIEILHDYMIWIDSLVGKGVDPVVDLPLPYLQQKMEFTVSAIYNVVPCQFNTFRLAIFTTLLIGTAELKPGRHLRQLMFPMKGTASFNHLANPSAAQMSKERAQELSRHARGIEVANDGVSNVPGSSHDNIMQLLAMQFNLPNYNRDEIECLLCESFPGRNLMCRDWFRKGQNLYDIDDDGVVREKKYGMESEWEVVASSGRCSQVEFENRTNGKL